VRAEEGSLRHAHHNKGREQHTDQTPYCRGHGRGSTDRGDRSNAPSSCRTSAVNSSCWSRPSGHSAGTRTRAALSGIARRVRSFEYGVGKVILPV